MVRTPGGPLTFRHGCRWTQAHLWLAFACGRKHIPSAVLPHPGAGVPVHKRRLVPQANPCGNALQACSEPVWGRPLPRRPRAGRWPPSPRGRHRLCLPAACGAPATMAASLTAARDRLAVMHAENLSVAAAFDLSYADLTPRQQRLFRRLGLILGADFDARATAALDDTSLDTARRGLDELYDQHLITEPAPGRYQLHDLLREYARTLAAADAPAESEAATTRLLDYYLHTALAAGQHIVRSRLPVGPLPPARPPPCAPPLSTPGQAAVWLEAER